MAEVGGTKQSLLWSDSREHSQYSSELGTGSGQRRNYGGMDAPQVRMTHSESVLLEPEPVTLSWINIKVFVQDKSKKKTPPSRTVEVGAKQGAGNADAFQPAVTVSDGQKPILKGVSGVVKPGTLLAIIGASGAGKSTLMNVLTNRNLKGYQLEGDIRINGIAIGNGMRNISAYVQQNDLFFSTLTVQETLTFRAFLRMDQSITKAARLERVEEVILEMGLTKCADTQIGMAGGKKGISGGESKRLSFACEMLMNPPLLFCDEPTSGLDSYMAQNIVQTLQAMALKNRTVLCTIHQPSSEIFALFDQVLLMAEGRVAFMGPSIQAMEFFASLNYVCPSNYNPADFYILTLAIMPGKEEECRHKVNAICDSFTETKEADDINRSIARVTAEGRADAPLMREAFSSESRYKASWFRQFFIILWRNWISLMRNTVLFRVRIMQTMVVAVVLGLVYLRLDYNQKGVMNINGAIFLILTNASFSNMYAVINSFPCETAIFLREYGSGLYRTDVYFLAKNLAEFPAFVVLPFLFITIDYWMVGLYETWQAYLIASGIIVLVSNVAVSFGLIISTLAEDVNIALAVAPPIIVPFMMFGGFFLNNDSVPVYFVWLKYLSWFKYANEYLVVNQWQDVHSIDCDKNETCQYTRGEDVLHYLSFSADNNWLNLGLLFALFLGFRLFSYIFLLIRARLSKM